MIRAWTGHPSTDWLSNKRATPRAHTSAAARARSLAHASAIVRPGVAEFRPRRNFAIHLEDEEAAESERTPESKSNPRKTAGNERRLPRALLTGSEESGQALTDASVDMESARMLQK